jgi:sulfatase maturation enzyme AslB (radical SAM superfamily)
LTQLRTQFDQGQQPSACNRCWIVEKYGHKSRRQSAIEFFQDTIPDNVVQLQSIDHSATWACNLACIMCEPRNSSLWATQENLTQDDLRALGRYFQKSNNFLDKLDVGHIKKIHFNGGEPMLNNDQTELLLKLEEQGVLENTFISYNTNGTVMPSQQVIDLWKRARLVKIFFSIDAVGSAFEYVRWPGKWDQTSKNILDMRDMLSGNVMFGFNTTVGNYNILEIAEVYNWFTKHIQTNREGDPSDFCWQLAGNFDPGAVSRIIKQQAITELTSIAQLSGLVGYLRATLNAPENMSWVTTLDKLDAKRNTNWRTALTIAKFIEESHC